MLCRQGDVRDKSRQEERGDNVNPWCQAACPWQSCRGGIQGKANSFPHPSGPLTSLCPFVLEEMLWLEHEVISFGFSPAPALQGDRKRLFSSPFNAQPKRLL